jgi:hypothetical protein
MAKAPKTPQSRNAKNEAMQAWNMQFPTSAGGTFGGIKIPPQGNPNAAIDTTTLRGIHGEIKNLNMGLALSFQGLSQGIQSLVELQEKSIITDKKEDSKDDNDKARAVAKGKAKDIEEERESRLKKMGGSLKEGATTVVQKVSSGFSLGGFLSTLIGGALLAAIFAPEVYKKLENQIKSAFSVVMDNEFIKKVVDKGWKTLKKNFELDNLMVSAVFGWRSGVLYSAGELLGEYFGKWIAETLDDGLKWIEKQLEKVGLGGGAGQGELDIGADVGGLSQSMKDAIISNAGTIFAVGGLATALLPSLAILGIYKIVKATVGWAAARTLSTLGISGTAAMTDAAATKAADDLIPRDEKGRFIKRAKATKATMGKSLGRMLSVGSRALGIIGAMYAVYTVVDTIIDEANKALDRGKKALEDGKVPEAALTGLDATEMAVARAKRAQETPQDSAVRKNQEQELIKSIESQSGRKYTATKREERTYGPAPSTIFGKTIAGTTGPISDRVLRAMAVYALSTEKPVQTKEKIINDMRASAPGTRVKFQLIYQKEVEKNSQIKTTSDNIGIDTAMSDSATVMAKGASALKPGELLKLNTQQLGWESGWSADMGSSRMAKGASALKPGELLKLNTQQLGWESGWSADMGSSRQNLNNDDVMGDTLGVADTLEKAADIAIEQAPKWYDFITKALTPNSIYVHDTHVEAQLKKIENPTAALVGAASASQASATNVIMMGGMGGGPQTAAAASGSSTVNNTSVQSSVNNNLSSMSEENRANAAHASRFGAG